MLLIYAFTQWLAALALVAANAEMRFLWLGLATAVLVWVVLRSRRYPSRDAQRLADSATQEQGPESAPLLQNSSNDRS